MRDIKYIVVHCTATPQTTSIDSIKRYWKNVKKWKQVGYHYIIEANGKFTQLASLAKVTNGVAGHNKNSVHVAYVGGVVDAINWKPIDNRTKAQKDALVARISQLKNMFPEAKVLGHRDFPNVKKACPCFDAISEYQNL